MLLYQQIEQKMDVKEMSKFDLICAILSAEDHMAWAKEHGFKNTSWASLDNREFYVRELCKRDLKVAIQYM